MADAEAICEAVRRPTMRFVETKTPAPKKGRKRVSAQTEMLLPIAGKKGKEAVAKPIAAEKGWLGARLVGRASWQTCDCRVPPSYCSSRKASSSAAPAALRNSQHEPKRQDDQKRAANEQTIRSICGERERGTEKINRD